MENRYILPYGCGEITFQLPQNSANIDIYYPPQINNIPVNAEDVYQILQKNALEILSGSHVAIAINDKTRPVRYDVLLIPLLHSLQKWGVSKENITLFISTGTHTPLKNKEFAEFIPSEVIQGYQILCHDCDATSQLQDLGTTSRGTPVLINKSFYNANFKITLGNIEPHHFMGFSGGAKTAGIGLTGRRTIEANHRLLLQPHTETGEYEKNPMRQDLEEISDLIQITACLNAVMDYKKNVLKVLWDKPRAVMQQGIPASKALTQVAIPPLYDLVIASAGGYPKDINFYQSQKALTNACMICKSNGNIILAAECREGAGNQKYVDFMQGKTSFQQILDEFGKIPFQIGPHKAYLVARQGLKYNLYLQSCMPDAMVHRLLISPIHSIQDFLDSFKLSGIRIALLPYGASTMPYWGRSDSI